MRNNVIKFECSPAAFRRRLNDLQRVLNDRNERIDALLDQVHEESMQGCNSQNLYDDLLKEYIESVGIDNVRIEDLSYSTNLEFRTDSDGNLKIMTEEEIEAFIGEHSGDNEDE